MTVSLPAPPALPALRGSSGTAGTSGAQPTPSPTGSPIAPGPARRGAPYPAAVPGAAALVVTLPDSRPPAFCWSVRPQPTSPPHQPLLDLRAAPEPLVITCPGDLAERAPEGLPDARSWSVALATTLLEVVLARRSPAQLSRWVSEEVLVALPRLLPNRPAQAALRAATGGGAARLQSLRLQYPTTGVAEASVHARFGPRSLAMALRLEAARSRWLCTALELRAAVPAPAAGST